MVEQAIFSRSETITIVVSLVGYAFLVATALVSSIIYMRTELAKMVTQNSYNEKEICKNAQEIKDARLEFTRQIAEMKADLIARFQRLEDHILDKP